MSKILSLIGKPIFGNEMEEFISSMGYPPEVEDVFGDGNVDLQFKKSGIGISLGRGGIVNVVHCMLRARDEYLPFCGQIPHELSADFTTERVKQQLGNPTVSGGGTRDPNIGDILPIWFRYEYPEYSLHIEFGRNEVGREEISMITIMDPEATPS